jgi:hypothetical protein
MLPTRNTVVVLRSLARAAGFLCSAFVIGKAYHRGAATIILSNRYKLPEPEIYIFRTPSPQVL